MARLVLSLVLSAACSGCAAHVGRIAPPARTIPTGIVKVLVGFPTPAADLMRVGLGDGDDARRSGPFIPGGDDFLLANPVFGGS